MVHIALSTGSRRRPSKRMEASKEKFGRVPVVISVIGAITAKKVLEYNSIPKVTSTKECGPWTRNMVKELTGEMKVENFVESTPATGSKTRNMAEAPFSLRIATGTMAIGSMECRKEKVV